MLQSEQDERNVHYRSLSGLAVASLLFTLLGVASLTHPAAWVTPLPSIVCGLLALRQIGRQPEQFTGRKIALSGLAISCFLLGLAPARYFSERQILTAQSRQFAEEWFQQVLDGHLEAAHQATLPVHRRQPAGTILEEFYQSSPEDLQELQTFFSQGIARDISALGADGSFRFHQSLGAGVRRDGGHVFLRYYFSDQRNGATVAHAQVEIVRIKASEGIYWILQGLADADRLDALEAQR